MGAKPFKGSSHPSQESTSINLDFQKQSSTKPWIDESISPKGITVPECTQSGKIEHQLQQNVTMTIWTSCRSGALELGAAKDTKRLAESPGYSDLPHAWASAPASCFEGAKVRPAWATSEGRVGAI